jgi:uncharacterized membrane protein
MIIWGIVWGAIFGAMLSRYEEIGFIVGGIFGALAGLTLRFAVRNETERIAKKQIDEARRARVEGERLAQIKTSADADQAQVAANKVEPTAPAQPSPAAATNPALAVAAVPQAEASSAETGTLATAPKAALAADAAKTVTKPPAPVAPTKPPTPDPVTVLIGKAKAWLLGGNTVARVGAIVLFIGLSFLAKWAADNALFPPEARLAGIGLVGIALLVQGSRLAKRASGAADKEDGAQSRYDYSLLLQGTGVAVLYLTVFAAFRLYGMIPQLAAFVLMAFVCALSTLIALLRNSQALAFVGFLGAFASPILVSTGGGSHVALFGYYLMLNLAIAVIAYLRAWRALNLLGFLATFGIATLWGALKYVPEQYASTQPFLIAFFAIYVAIGLFYALRHSSGKNHTLDGMIVFGTPIVSFALQTQLVDKFEYGAAISAVAASAMYVVLALFTRRKESPVANWLTMSYAALGLIFATLAVPLAFDAKLTAAIWAVEGAGVFWLAKTQKRWIGQGFGLLMQLLAAVAFGHAFESETATAQRAFANSYFVGSLMLALSALAISWWSFVESKLAQNSIDKEKSTAFSNYGILAAITNLIGFAWLLYGFGAEITSSALGLVDASRARWLMFTFVALASAFAFVWTRKGWHGMQLPGHAIMPVMLLAALVGIALDHQRLFALDGLLWVVAISLHLFTLRRLDGEPPRPWWSFVHAANTLLAVLLLGNVLYRLIDSANLWRSDWASVIFLVASALIVAVLTAPKIWRDAPSSWPLDRFQRSYALYAGSFLAALTTCVALIVTSVASGRADPLPYIPFLNPVDLSVAIALASVALWLKRLRSSKLVSSGNSLRGIAPIAALAAVSFVAVNTVWLRFAHHFRGIAWNFDSLASSFFVQAGYSVLWTLLGVALMVFAHRKATRRLWQVGAALLGLTVVKLLLVDLANSGGGERIVAFIGVGMLMVAVGYFAPMPPTKSNAITESAKGSV